MVSCYEIQTITKAQQNKKGQLQHPKHTPNDRYLLLEREDQLKIFWLRTGHIRLRHYLLTILLHWTVRPVALVSGTYDFRTHPPQLSTARCCKGQGLWTVRPVSLWSGTYDFRAHPPQLSTACCIKGQGL
eukprot:TRINITY_DN40201_c0_g1_i4.p1 TRINITY_DN40201_c0_g1~~TRINITY_DN40201_c0_g1_i4.p1  ORF type:complete len:130 (+),score=21.67 TRINITY_DN40201_c0_g1_i4:64-453(+)